MKEDRVKVLFAYAHHYTRERETCRVSAWKPNSAKIQVAMTSQYLKASPDINNKATLNQYLSNDPSAREPELTLKHWLTTSYGTIPKVRKTPVSVGIMLVA